MTEGLKVEDLAYCGFENFVELQIGRKLYLSGEGHGWWVTWSRTKEEALEYVKEESQNGKGWFF